MTSDPLAAHLAFVTSPLQAGPLYTTFKDLALSVEWQDLRAMVLPGTEWAVIIGHKRPSDPLKVVLPLPLHTTALRPSSLKSIFSSLSKLPLKDIPESVGDLVPTIKEIRRRAGLDLKSGVKLSSAQSQQRFDTHEDEDVPEKEADGEGAELDREMIYVAISISDSTVVYYKLTKGIKKPADVPDE